MSMKFGKASNRRLTLAAVPRESGAADRLLDNSRQMVRLDLIDDNRRNPRKRLDEESLRELAASIAEHGLLQAPVVRRHPDDPDRYMVVLGARRVAAHRLLGRDEIEVIVRRLEDGQAFIASCVENVQRVELSPREEMDMIGVLIDELGSQEAAARALGKSPTWLSKRKRVLAAPAFASAVEHGELSLDHAYDLIARSPDEPTALAHLERVRASGQNQGATRDALAPRPRPAVLTAEFAATPAPPPGHTWAERATEGQTPISARNSREGTVTMPTPSSLARPASNDKADDRDQVARQGQAPIDGAIPVSGRNRGHERSASSDDVGDELVDLDTLAVVRLVQGRHGRASRQAVLDALRADLSTLEGD